MQSLKKRRRVRLIAMSTFLLIFATFLLGYAMRDGIQFFKTPSQILSDIPGEQEVFRIGGMIELDSIVRKDTNVLFRVTDGTSTVSVTYSGLLPDLFKEGEGVIASGIFRDGQVHAHEILAKHDEDYMPRELAGMAVLN